MPAFEDATTIERTAFDKTNEARVQNGLQPLAWDPLLCKMARMHSEDMARRGYFAHETPEGLEPKDRGRALGLLHFRVLAENIAFNKGFADPGAFAVERWMTSGGHRANILYIGFQSSAIGSYVAADGSVYVTQVFLTR
ncbi:MAG: CAP domain-containing protein [bacterium]